MKKWDFSRWISLGRKLLFPNGAITLLCILVSSAVLVYALVLGNTESMIAYVGYAFSAYTLTVIVIKIPPIVQKIKAGLYANKYSRTLLTERELRAEIGLYAGFGINIAYAILKFMAGVHFQSIWIGAVGVYYAILGGIRFGLIYREQHSVKCEDAIMQRKRDLKTYRNCGCFVFLLNIAVAGLVVQMVWQNKSFTYPGLMIYASAAYTFYCFAMAIVNLVKYRKLERPIMSAAKMISFACALTSILALQTGLLAEFGSDQPNFIRTMNSLTGAAVCLLVFGLAIHMIKRANKELRKMIYD